MDKSLILKEIKRYKNFKTDKEFANYLGVTPQGLASWYKRNRFNIELIYSKFESINPEWLLTGKGAMLKSENSAKKFGADTILFIKLMYI